MAARDSATDRVPCHVALVAGHRDLFVHTRPAHRVPYWRVVVDNQVTLYVQVIVIVMQEAFSQHVLSNRLFLERKTYRSLFVYITDRETRFSTAWYSTV